MDEVTRIYGHRLRIRACGIAVHQNSVLLVRHEGLGEAGTLWSFPGGGPEYGETLPEALRREFREETGLIVEVGRQLFVYEYIKEPLHALEVYFQVKVTGGQLSTGHDPEMPDDAQMIREVKYVTFDELGVMNDRIKHEMLRLYNGREALLNLSGYFKF